MSVQRLIAIPLLILVVVSAFIGAGNDENPAAQSPDSVENYESIWHETTGEIEFWTARAEGRPDVWSSRERLAAVYLRRAKLTGDFSDYMAAERALTAAFDQAEPGAGPFLLRARLNFTLHRLDLVEPDLGIEEQRVLLDNRTRAAVEGMRADVAFHRGRYGDAKAGYETALRLHRSVDSLCRIAHFYWKTGELETAEVLYDQAESLIQGKAVMLRAWLDLQRGLLDLDRRALGEALAHYRDADQHVGQWWLVEEHMAEIYALTGAAPKARSMYEDLVARTGSPEFMGALAKLVEGREKRHWLRQADLAYQNRLSIYPEAALGHAIQYALIHVPDHGRVVQWATQNFQLRPGGEAGVLLAQAYHRAGRISEARATIEAVLATPYSTPDLRQTADLILGPADRRSSSD